MKVVIDTNVLLMSIPKISKYRPIFDGLLQGDYDLAITEDILQEYLRLLEAKQQGQLHRI